MKTTEFKNLYNYSYKFYNANKERIENIRLTHERVKSALISRNRKFWSRYI